MSSPAIITTPSRTSKRYNIPDNKLPWRCRNLVVLGLARFSLSALSHHARPCRIHLCNQQKHFCSSQKLFLSSTPIKSNVGGGANDTLQEKSIDDTTELSQEDKRKLKILKLEHYMLVSEGIESVPDSVSDEEWMYLLKSCPTEAIRLKRYKVLYWQQKQEIEKVEMTDVEEKSETEALEEGRGYTPGSFKNQLSLHVQRARVNLFQYNNMFYSMINGPHLVFDCSFEKHMKERYLKSVITQIGHIYGNNKATNEPFHLHFCNVPLDGQTQVLLAKHFGDKLSQIPITITHKSYLDCYSKESLVYLSPDASTIMEKYNPDDVYIIGCIDDAGLLKRHTADKAKKENIRAMRFPIDQYVRWEQGYKSLSLPPVVDILQYVKNTNDWRSAFLKHLPPNCIKPSVGRRKGLDDFDDL